jgi:uncharacterized protein involved in exopolysaccharide biosynthesis
MSEYNRPDASEEMDLFAIVKVLWAARVTVIIITTSVVLAGIAYALLAPERYRAEVIMTSAGQRSAPGALNQLGGIAALAGVSIGSNNLAVPVAVLKSNGLAREFIDEMGIEKDLLRASNKEDADIRDAVLLFDSEIRRVYEDKKSGIVTLTIDWTDPVIAASWANALVARLNDRMRRQALDEAERNVEFLRKEMAGTDLISQQQSIGRVLEAEMQKLTLARGNEEFSLRVLDPATPPKLRNSPRRTLIVLLSGILGFGFAITLVIGRHLIRVNNRASI